MNDCPKEEYYLVELDPPYNEPRYSDTLLMKIQWTDPS